MADPERPAGDRVDRRAVGGAVVGHDPLGLDAVAAVEGQGPLEEADRRSRRALRSPSRLESSWVKTGFRSNPLPHPAAAGPPGPAACVFVLADARESAVRAVK